MISEFLNLQKHALDRPESETYRTLVCSCREQLAINKMINVENFLTEKGTQRVAQEIEERLPNAFHSARQANPYGVTATDDLPEDHPYRLFASTDRYGLARHQLKARR